MREKPILVTKATLPPMEEFIKMLEPIWESAWLTNMGMQHKKLESLLLDYLDIENVILFTNGHLALEMLLQALDLKGEVITTPFTFVSTTHAIVRNNLEPVFCDINPDDYTIDVEKIEEKITKNTAAILPVHVYGNICNVERIGEIAKKHNLKVIYDAAHTFGESYKGVNVSNFGDASMFSFHATKVFNTIEGGAVTTKDLALRKKLDYLKNFGIEDKETVNLVGGNAKMNEFQAAMGLCNLLHIDEMIEKRKIIATLYRELLSEIDGIILNYINPKVKYNYAYFPIVIDEKITGFTRDDLFNALAKENIFARKYFYPCINALDCYKGKYNFEDTKVADYISKRVLTLPIYPDLEKEVVFEIFEVIKGLKK